MNTPRIVDIFLLDEGYCANCGRELEATARHYIVDPEGWANPCCDEECAEAEAEALAALNPDTDWSN